MTLTFFNILVLAFVFATLQSCTLAAPSSQKSQIAKAKVLLTNEQPFCRTFLNGQRPFQSTKIVTTTSTSTVAPTKTVTVTSKVADATSFVTSTKQVTQTSTVLQTTSLTAYSAIATTTVSAGSTETVTDYSTYVVDTTAAPAKRASRIQKTQIPKSVKGYSNVVITDACLEVLYGTYSSLPATSIKTKTVTAPSGKKTATVTNIINITATLTKTLTNTNTATINQTISNYATESVTATSFDNAGTKTVSVSATSTVVSSDYGHLKVTSGPNAGQNIYVSSQDGSYFTYSSTQQTIFYLNPDNGRLSDRDQQHFAIELQGGNSLDYIMSYSLKGQAYYNSPFLACSKDDSGALTCKVDTLTVLYTCTNYSTDKLLMGIPDQAAYYGCTQVGLQFVPATDFYL